MPLDWIVRAIHGSSESTFIADETLCFAVAHKLSIVGEAAARLSAELAGKFSTVPWRDIVGLRNALVHEYFGIYWPLVFQTAETDVPRLREQVANILRSEFPE